MDYSQTLEYLFKQLPMYQRVGQAAYKTDLTNTLQLCEILEHPETGFRSIHVAGTNGKGSTSHMLASVLQQAGYRVGLYTSPHLKDFRERIKINGEMIPEDEVIRFVEQFRHEFEAIQLSFFEWTVGLAFHYFTREKVDIAVIETGMGGRLDSTNVVVPEVSVITNIGYDHTQFLGDTLEKIAGEKAGIIKPGVPVIIGEEQAETKAVFTSKAQAKGCSIQFASRLETGYETDLKGFYQRSNIKTVVATLNQMKTLGWKIPDEAIRIGLTRVVANTGLMGRWQQIGTRPKIICDTGHNESGIRMIVDQLNQEDYQRLRMVFGAVNDKAIDQVLALLPLNADYYFCKADLPRALDAGELQKQAAGFQLSGRVYPSVKAAFEAAREESSEDDLIFVGGSTFVVAEVL
ncbi:MAG: bifunctional folylpolyglutamate synthase/dihydrofolate synthase [Flavobacteriales bacterium]|nr:bifunctional folylpolyglutamate synthase/dihydrofolate synthase [Flavobacteriales bacterium]